MRKLTSIFVAAVLTLFTYPADAQKAAIPTISLITFVNDSGQTIVLSQQATDCVTPVPALPLTLAPDTETRVYFWAWDCPLEFAFLSAQGTWHGSSKPTVTDMMQIFINSGVPSVSFLSAPADNGSRFEILPPGNPTVTFINRSYVDIPAAMAGPCWTGQDGKAAVGKLALYSDIGSKTSEKIRSFKTDRFVTQLRVTSEIWGFRGLTIGGELKWLKAGFLISKATKRLQALDVDERQALWQEIGPHLLNDNSAQQTGFGWLALQSSDEPKSQTVSVALDYKTASAFGSVYAFRLRPNSEIFGLVKCNTFAAGGEVQLQPAGGTPIFDLMRYDSPGKWSAWNGTNFVPSTVVPDNQLSASRRVEVRPQTMAK